MKSRNGPRSFGWTSKTCAQPKRKFVGKILVFSSYTFFCRQTCAMLTHARDRSVVLSLSLWSPPKAEHYIAADRRLRCVAFFVACRQLSPKSTSRSSGEYIQSAVDGVR